MIFRYIVVGSVTSANMGLRRSNAKALRTKLLTAAANPATLLTLAPVTQSLFFSMPLTADALVEILGYNEVEIHNTSQNLIQNIMYYYIDQNQRLNFMDFPKPSNLPISLGENLLGNLKTWIKKTYALAYISFMIS